MIVVLPIQLYDWILVMPNGVQICIKVNVDKIWSIGYSHQILLQVPITLGQSGHTYLVLKLSYLNFDYLHTTT